MCLAMLAERFAGHESFPTVGALVGSLPSVYSTVDDKSRVGSEFFPTVGTDEEPVFRVALAMLVEGLLGHEAFPAVRALVGSLPGVYPPVDDKS